MQINYVGEFSMVGGGVTIIAKAVSASAPKASIA